jgi:hypothetical protein
MNHPADTPRNESIAFCPTHNGMVVKVRGEVDVAFGPDIESAILAVC